MAGFTENVLVHKLQELNETQQKIQTLSLWLLHHKKHYVVVVRTWFREMMKIKDRKLLSFMYLANDVIQNSKKEGPEYGYEFEKVLVESFKHMNTTGIDTETKTALYRILTMWEERGIYSSQKIQQFKEAIDQQKALTKHASKRLSEDREGVNELEKRAKIEEKGHCHQCGDLRTLGKVPTLNLNTPLEDISEAADPSQLQNFLQALLQGPKPRNPEELIRALVELDESNSSDEAIRQRIAESPPELVEKVNFLSKMPPFQRINFIIHLVRRLYYEKKLERALKINLLKIEIFKRAHNM